MKRQDKSVGKLKNPAPICRVLDSRYSFFGVYDRLLRQRQR
jgi:hypothetical protein